MSIFPSLHTVCHIARYFDETAEDDHGNSVLVTKPPVLRKVISIAQMGGRGSYEQFSEEFLARVETTLLMVVADPETYRNDDIIVLKPGVDVDGSYVTNSGIRYVVDGEPFDDRLGPWPKALKAFGGGLRIRRVT